MKVTVFWDVALCSLVFPVSPKNDPYVNKEGLEGLEGDRCAYVSLVRIHKNSVN
jgi:hypothetical protein